MISEKTRLIGLLAICLLPFCGTASGGENASNPLAAVSNTDVRWQYLKSDEASARLNDVFVDGAVMATEKLKIKYELHYWETNLTGRSEHDWESASVKAIYFPTEGVLESGTTYRLATGVDYIYDFDNTDKGIGMGTDQIAPFVGVALNLESGATIIPLLQHFEGVGGGDVSITSARVIAIQPLAERRWLKFDIRVPYDWDNEVVPAEGEIQFGDYFAESVALYLDGKFGIGSDRLYDWGVGVGIRFSY
ncbi:MAG: hypothetical protein V7754_22010 [Halioglobus sp.]